VQQHQQAAHRHLRVGNQHARQRRHEQQERKQREQRVEGDLGRDRLQVVVRAASATGARACAGPPSARVRPAASLSAFPAPRLAVERPSAVDRRAAACLRRPDIGPTRPVRARDAAPGSPVAPAGRACPGARGDRTSAAHSEPGGHGAARSPTMPSPAIGTSRGHVLEPVVHLALRLVTRQAVALLDPADSADPASPR